MSYELSTDQPDDADLLNAARLTQEWLEISGLAQRRPAHLLTTLVRNSENYAKEGISKADWRYTAAELNATMKDQEEGDDEPDVARRYVKENLAGYNKLVSEHRDSLRDYLAKQSVRHTVEIASTGSQGRNKNYYYLQLKKVETPDVNADAATDNELVRYTQSDLTNPPIWAKPFISTRLKSMEGLALFCLLLCCILTAITFGGLTLITVTTAGISSIGGMLIAGVIMWAIWPFFMALNQSVAIAPIWLSGVSTQSCVLETVPDEAGKILQLKIYDGLCTRCGGKLQIEAGKGQMGGRLVGRCKDARAEHVYTFDHITKTGTPTLECG